MPTLLRGAGKLVGPPYICILRIYKDIVLVGRKVSRGRLWNVGRLPNYCGDKILSAKKFIKYDLCIGELAVV
jgi:hypothetical protein